MKKIALYLFLLFSLVQFGPGMKAIFSSPEAISLFNPDEEKNTDGNKAADSEKKTAKKEFISALAKPMGTPDQLVAHLQTQDMIITAPQLDILTPPPNPA